MAIVTETGEQSIALKTENITEAKNLFIDALQKAMISPSQSVESSGLNNPVPDFAKADVAPAPTNGDLFADKLVTGESIAQNPISSQEPVISNASASVDMTKDEKIVALRSILLAMKEQAEATLEQAAVGNKLLDELEASKSSDILAATASPDTFVPQAPVTDNITPIAPYLPEGAPIMEVPVNEGVSASTLPEITPISQAITDVAPAPVPEQPVIQNPQGEVSPFAQGQPVSGNLFDDPAPAQTVANQGQTIAA